MSKKVLKKPSHGHNMPRQDDFAIPFSCPPLWNQHHHRRPLLYLFLAKEMLREITAQGFWGRGSKVDRLNR